MDKSLKAGTLLQGGRYKILGVLGHGGFGITYLAVQTGLGAKVAVKEFFFNEYCERDATTSHVTVPTAGNRKTVDHYKRKFVKEAKTIFKLRHPNIVRIHDTFEENDTAYYVMEYVDGGSLGDMVKRRGSIPEHEAVDYIKKVASALSYIHSKGLNHLDIKPNNLMRRSKDGEILVIDFGVAKQFDEENCNNTTTAACFSRGYSPLEQYSVNGIREFSPQSDVYSLAATLFKLLTGETPPEASSVIDEGLPLAKLLEKGVSYHVVNAIVAAMRTKSQRTPSIEAFAANLECATNNVVINEDTVIKPNVQKVPTPTGAKPSSRLIKFLWVLVVAAAAVLIVVVIGINKKESGPDSNTSPDSDINAVTDDTDSEGEPQSTDFNGVVTVNGVTFDMVHVPGGTFEMGATSEQQHIGSDERPVHTVILSDYYIGRTEVTQALWQAVMGDNPSYHRGDDLPVEQVSWYDCQDFIQKLNSLTGQDFRLPTEAEWEYAARGGANNGNQYSGSNNLSEVAWCKGKTHPVATKAANELGIYDMSGNVWEWCQDWYGNYNSGAQTDPIGPGSGSRRVYRGGGWDGVVSGCRVAFRGDRGIPSDSDCYIGLRLALSK
ncbi:MAG: bifunctional serine/threonine-protein kinase/formylglycine-generating enzyme family protein [Muribaculaceae bacterium]|nr:bifunctional serine/threonine-protein kinase/formylglycine-generating enzyme family protein [Muribaculaceae bacterium]